MVLGYYWVLSNRRIDMLCAVTVGVDAADTVLTLTCTYLQSHTPHIKQARAYGFGTTPNICRN